MIKTALIVLATLLLFEVAKHLFLNDALAGMFGA